MLGIHTFAIIARGADVVLLWDFSEVMFPNHILSGDALFLL
jgi:hypothetical protein